MEKQNPNIDFDHYLLKGVFLNAGEGVKMQYAQEHWGDGQEAHATELYRMTPDERRNLPSENVVCERYLAKISSLVSISAARSNNFLKAERSWDDSMSDSNKKEKALNNSQTKLSSHWNQWKLSGQNSRRLHLRSKKQIKDNMKKKEHSNNPYGDDAFWKGTSSTLVLFSL